MFDLNIIVCVDNRNGMMFNNRRLSSDSILRQNIFQTITGSKLWMNSYSSKQFTEGNPAIEVCDNFIQKASGNDYCFVENPDDLVGVTADRIIIYRWNRDYPADQFFNMDISDRKILLTEDFQGSSHDKITKEVYE